MQKQNTYKRKILVVLLWASLLMPAIHWFPSSAAQAAQTFNGVGFASMQKFPFQSEIWSHNFSILAQQSFWMKYSSFKQVAQKLQVQNLKPLTLELNGRAVLPANQEIVQRFHRKFDQQGERFLRNLALENNALLVVFDSVEKQPTKMYVKDRMDNLMVTVMVYHLDANTVGLEHIPISKKEFNRKHIDYSGIKAKFHERILAALEGAIPHAQGIAGQQQLPDDSESGPEPNTDESGSGTESGPATEDNGGGSTSQGGFWD